MSDLRPLPARPSLEFDRKEAKALHRLLRAGDGNALARAHAHHPALASVTPASIKLADAQLVIAREYGFASWARLVHYYAGVSRQRMNAQWPPSLEFFHDNVRSILAGHRAQRELTGRTLAAYVPRFYGIRIADVFTHDITEDDARLCVARRNGCPSWEVLLEHAAVEIRPPVNEWGVRPWQQASQVIDAGDLPALQQLVMAHPELLHPTESEISRAGSLLNLAFQAERVRGRDALRPMVEWLASQGLDVQHELNVCLCGHLYMKTDEVHSLLERGANAHWVDSNDVSVLEYALLRYWNSEAVDLVAARTVPRQALWIAAGLGDVQGVSHFLDKHGKPTAAARRDRPPFSAVSAMWLPSLPEPDDEEILYEAFLVAVLNARTNVMEYMASRGFNVDSRLWGAPVVNIAAGNGWTAAVESLMRCGANLDLRGWDSNGTAREMARERFENSPGNKDYRRIVELFGLDPVAILAERDARTFTVPTIAPKLQQALRHAMNDAHGQGQSHVREEHLLVGLLRGGGLPLLFFTDVSQLDQERFFSDMRSRVHPGLAEVGHTALPVHAEAQAFIDAATALAAERRRETVEGLHLLFVLLRDPKGVAAQMLARYGGNAQKLMEEIKRGV